MSLSIGRLHRRSLVYVLIAIACVIGIGQLYLGYVIGRGVCRYRYFTNTREMDITHVIPETDLSVRFEVGFDTELLIISVDGKEMSDSIFYREEWSKQSSVSFLYIPQRDEVVLLLRKYGDEVYNPETCQFDKIDVVYDSSCIILPRHPRLNYKVLTKKEDYFDLYPLTEDLSSSSEPSYVEVTIDSFYGILYGITVTADDGRVIYRYERMDVLSLFGDEAKKNDYRGYIIKTSEDYEEEK